ncbi:MAG TPA: hypothetical protein VNB23_09295 [Ramlibacter sp.]|nr:hypothetical protein [Ramlibacter sp.]
MQNELLQLRKRLTEILRQESAALEVARGMSASDASNAEVAAAMQLAEELRHERTQLAEELRRREFAGR